MSYSIGQTMRPPASPTSRPVLFMFAGLLTVSALMTAGCGNARGEPCATADVCKSGLLCAGGVCADPKQACAASPGCADGGLCTPSGGNCIVASDADCRSSTGCHDRGLCKAKVSRGKLDPGACVATSAADCRASTGCQRSARCALKDGRCVEDVAKLRAAKRQAAVGSIVGDWRVDLPASLKATANAKQAALQSRFMTEEEFSELRRRHAWAFFTKAKDCEGKSPPAEFAVCDENGRLVLNEFARRRSLKDAAKRRAEIKGALVKMSGTWKPSEYSSKCNDIEGMDDVEICRSDYDFERERYQFTVRAKDEFIWPLSLKGTKPKIATDRTVFTGSRTIGTLGGRDLKIRTNEVDVEYINASAFTFEWRVPIAEAEERAKSMRFDVLLVFEVVDMALHKRCRRNCGRILGQRVCVGENFGFLAGRAHILARIAQFTVTTGGKEVVGFRRVNKLSAAADKPTSKEPLGLIKRVSFGAVPANKDGTICTGTAVYLAKDGERTLRVRVAAKDSVKHDIEMHIEELGRPQRFDLKQDSMVIGIESVTSHLKRIAPRLESGVPPPLSPKSVKPPSARA